MPRLQHVLGHSNQRPDVLNGIGASAGYRGTFSIDAQKSRKRAQGIQATQIRVEQGLIFAG
jgi:hypothetical protein